MIIPNDIITEGIYHLNQNSEKYELKINIQNETMILSVKKEENFSLKYSFKIEYRDFIKKN